MTRLRRAAGSVQPGDDASQRLRAAWLYFSHGLTQKDVSERLGVSRGTVVRLLAEARERGEVQIWIGEGERDCIELALRLEDEFGLDEAIVVPGGENGSSARSVGLALGRFLSEVVSDNQTIGVGWGRTLMASLASLRPVRRDGVKLVSMVGGVVKTHGGNPLEYTWRVASQFAAECFLFIAPAFVDSVETRRRLIEDCGLDALYQLGRSLDIAVVGIGGVGGPQLSQASTMVSAEALEELTAIGAVGDVLCNFIDAEGRSVAHGLNERVMSVPLDDVAKAGHVVIAAGGADRAIAIRAAIRRIGCNTLITDEGAARLLVGEGR